MLNEWDWPELTLLLVCSRWCVGYEMMWPRVRSVVKSQMKVCAQKNILKYVTGITKSGDGIRTI